MCCAFDDFRSSRKRPWTIATLRLFCFSPADFLCCPNAPTPHSFTAFGKLNRTPSPIRSRTWTSAAELRLAIRSVEARECRWRFVLYRRFWRRSCFSGRSSWFAEEQWHQSVLKIGRSWVPGSKVSYWPFLHKNNFWLSSKISCWLFLVIYT